MTGITSKTRTSANAGIFYHIPIASIFSLQPEVIYSGEGVKTSGNKSEINTVLQYVTVPLMLQANAPMGFYAETGPAFGVLVKGKETNNNNGVTSELDLKKSVKKTAVSWGVGAGFSKKSIGVYARYNFGLSNLAKVSGDEMKSNGVQAGISWSFKQ